MSATQTGSIQASRNARAFNRGSDARIKGHSLDANPYDGTLDYDEHACWRKGWKDVDKNYPKRLPEVVS